MFSPQQKTKPPPTVNLSNPSHPTPHPHNFTSLKRFTSPKVPIGNMPLAIIQVAQVIGFITQSPQRDWNHSLQRGAPGPCCWVWFMVKLRLGQKLWWYLKEIGMPKGYEIWSVFHLNYIKTYSLGISLYPCQTKEKADHQLNTHGTTVGGHHVGVAL